jgi:hypothetical protein
VFIHIGEKKTISDKKIVGIFNYNTISNSELNVIYRHSVDDSQCDIKTIVIDRENITICSKVSPFTIIKRDVIENKDCVWRKK